MKKTNFHILCDKVGVDYKKAYSYKRRHPELTDNQVITCYRPECYINIFGALVVPHGDDFVILE